MKKILLSGIVAAGLFFNGCANNGLGVGTENVQKRFDNGTIESSSKVLVGKSNVATLTNVAGAGAVGAGIGAIAGDSTKATLIGAGVGAIAGAVFTSFQEVEAYEIEIKSVKDGVIRKGYIENELPLNTLIEYVVQGDGKITNIEVKKIGTPKEIIKEKIVEKEVIKTKIVEKPVYKTKEVIKEKIVEKPVLPVPEKKVIEAEKKVETPTNTKSSFSW